MSEPPILLQCEPPVATVVFNRPEARNALNEAMQLALPPMLVQLRAGCRHTRADPQGGRGKSVRGWR